MPSVHISSSNLQAMNSVSQSVQRNRIGFRCFASVMILPVVSVESLFSLSGWTSTYRLLVDMAVRMLLLSKLTRANSPKKILSAL